MATSKQTTTVNTTVSFSTAAAQIVAAHRVAAKATEKLGKTVQKIMIGFLDQCGDIPRTKDGCDQIGKAMRVELKDDGILGKALKDNIGLKLKSVKNYVTSAMIAHYYGIEWKAGLFNDGLPWNKDGTAKAPKADAKEPTKAAGKVQTTSVKDLQATLLKAIEQARLLNMRDLANALGSVAAERLDGFKFESKSE